jgi:hypothetical protein
LHQFLCNFDTQNLGNMIHLNLIQKYSFFLFLIGTLALNCAGPRQRLKQKTQNIDFLIKQGNSYWEQRADTLALKKAEHFIRLAFNENKQDFELAILYSKILYTRALFLETDNNVQSELFFQASQICREAIFNHSEFEIIYKESQGDSTFKILSSLAEAPRSLIPGLFWWTTNLGRYLNSQPVIERLNQRELVEVMMHRILSLDPGFYYSGPYRFFGSLYTRIPGVELSQSKTYFLQALSSNPDYLGNAVHMAEFYHQKAGNREQFHSMLLDVIDTDLTGNPELMAENLYYKERAKLLLKMESSLFE